MCAFGANTWSFSNSFQDKITFILSIALRCNLMNETCARCFALAFRLLKLQPKLSG